MEQLYPEIQMKQGYVYIMTNFKRTVLYIGVTNDLERRVKEYKSGKGSVFTSKYKCFYLIYFERMQEIKQAIKREKQLKNWKRKWKMNLIKESNHKWEDLSKDFQYYDCRDAEINSA